MRGSRRGCVRLKVCSLSLHPEISTMKIHVDINVKTIIAQIPTEVTVNTLLW